MQASDFKQLFLPCHRKLFSVAYRLMSNAQAAEDMVQETFLKLWMQRDKMEKVDNPEAYSITVLRRLFYDKMRAQIGPIFRLYRCERKLNHQPN